MSIIILNPIQIDACILTHILTGTLNTLVWSAKLSFEGEKIEL
jgi:hypothetical protein